MQELRMQYEWLAHVVNQNLDTGIVSDVSSDNTDDIDIPGWILSY